MLLEARIIRVQCAKNCDNWFQFLQVIEDKTGDTFLRQSVVGECARCLSANHSSFLVHTFSHCECLRIIHCTMEMNALCHWLHTINNSLQTVTENSGKQPF